MFSSKPIQPLGEHLSRAIAASSIDLTAHQRHDAIVVGAGAAGGVAADMLCEAGLRVLCLDAGSGSSLLKSPMRRTLGAVVRTLSNPALRRTLPGEVVRRSNELLRAAGKLRQPVQSESEAWSRLPEAFVDDKDNPFVAMDADPAFHWLRARLIGGRMALPGHDRQYYRMSPEDFGPSEDDPAGWPFTYEQFSRWYAFIEKRIGLSGRDESTGGVPQSVLTDHTPPNPAETALMDAVKQKWPRAPVMMGRHAPPPDFLERAAQTGYLLCRTGAIAQRVEVDGRGAVRGVHWHDLETGKMHKASAPIVFLCASGLESTRILMMSVENGANGQNGPLGRYLVDNVVQKAEGLGPALPAGSTTPEDGRAVYLPHFDARAGKGRSADGGFNVSVRQAPESIGRSWFNATATAQMRSNPSNRVSLDPDRLDAYGAPLMRIHCSRSQDELEAATARSDALRQLAETVGVELHRLDEKPLAPGLAAAEGGTARIGRNPDDSVLDPYNQCWDVKGLYVTDTAAMRSQGRVGPALTVMAMTARACAHALQTSPQENKAKERARARAARQAKAAEAVEAASTPKPAAKKPAAKKRKPQTAKRKPAKKPVKTSSKAKAKSE